MPIGEIFQFCNLPGELRFCCIDFETYFATKLGYTLRRQTIEEYVRDKRFAASTLGYDDGRGKNGFVRPQEIPEFLASVDWTTTGLLCHNTAFDGLILSHHFGMHALFYLDTLSMARACFPGQPASLEKLAAKFGLSPKIVPYQLMDSIHPSDMDDGLLDAIGQGAAQDCALTVELYRRMSDEFPCTELSIINLTIQMFTDPRLVGDVGMLQALQQEELDKRTELLDRLGVDPKDLGSSTTFKKLLEAHGVEVEMKNGKRGAIPAFAATDPFMQALQEDENPTVAGLAEARLLTKSNIRSTRAERLAGTAARGALPVHLNYFGATRTGRWSGGEKSNWQNFPRSGELGKCISAPPGHKLVIADAAQIEYRILCAVAGEAWPLDAFRQGQDVYCSVASSIFGRLITPANKPERFIGKKVTLSSGYGISGPTLYTRLRGEGVDISEAIAISAVAAYRELHPRVLQMWRQADKQVLYWLNTKKSETWIDGVLRTEDGSLVLPNGMRLQYRLRWNDDERNYYRFDHRSGAGGSKIWGSALVGETIQALASVFLRDVLLRIPLKPVCLRHDEAVFIVRDDEVERAMEIVAREFKRPPAWLLDCPLDCDVWISPTYSKEATCAPVLMMEAA